MTSTSRPADVDVWDPTVFVGATHVTDPERAALDKLKELGLVDLVRERWPIEVPAFSYWDYRAGASTRTSACGSIC